MKSHLGIVLATAAALGSAAFLIAGADAQQGPTPAPKPSASEVRTAPLSGSVANNFGCPYGPRFGHHGGFMARFSPQDRAAFLDAHLAAVKAGLELTPDQQKLWGPVEQAVRGLVKDMIAQRQKIAQQGRPTDPVERLQRAANVATTRGEDLHKLASAAQPFWASLSQDQKRRLPMLMHGMGGWAGMPGRVTTYHRTGTQPWYGWHERMRNRMPGYGWGSQGPMGRTMGRFAPGGDDGGR